MQCQVDLYEVFTDGERWPRIIVRQSWALARLLVHCEAYRASHEGNYGKMQKALMHWVSSQKGQDLLEYGLIIALVVVAALAALTLLGTSVSTLLSSLAGF